MTTADRHLALDLARVALVRRTVGPTPWVVLEALAGRSAASEAVVEIESSTRDLAELLGLSKDTVARALRVLARAELVRRVDRRSDRTGRFTATTYVVDLAGAGVTVLGEGGLPDMATAEVAAPTRPATDTLRAAGRHNPQPAHDPVQSAAGFGPVEHLVLDGSADPTSDSEPASSQLSLLS